jgi:hypothetical protein
MIAVNVYNYNNNYNILIFAPPLIRISLLMRVIYNSVRRIIITYFICVGRRGSLIRRSRDTGVKVSHERAAHDVIRVIRLYT